MAAERVPLSLLVARFARSAHDSLHAELRALGEGQQRGEGDEARRRRLLAHLSARRVQLVRLLALVKWAGRSGGVQEEVEQLGRVAELLDARDSRLHAAANAAAVRAQQIGAMQGPAFDVRTAVHVLTSGSYRLLPTCIEMAVPFERRMPADEAEATLRRLDDKLHIRLASSEIPRQFSRVRVERGLAYLEVPGEFEAGLSLRMLPQAAAAATAAAGGPDAGEDEQARVRWGLYHLRVLVAHPGGTLVGAHQTRALVAHVNRAVFESASPLATLYERVHLFCVRLQMDLLHAQCGRPEVRARFAGTSDVAYDRHRELTLRYWRGAPEVPLHGRAQGAAPQPPAEDVRLLFAVDAAGDLRVLHNPPLRGLGLRVDPARVSAADVVAAATVAHAAHRVRRLAAFLRDVPAPRCAFEGVAVRAAPAGEVPSLVVTLMGRAEVEVTADVQTGRFVFDWVLGAEEKGVAAAAAAAAEDAEDVEPVLLSEESMRLVKSAEADVNAKGVWHALEALRQLRAHAVLQHFAAMARRLGLEPLRRPPLVWSEGAAPFDESECLYIRMRAHPSFFMAVQLAGGGGTSLGVLLNLVMTRPLAEPLSDAAAAARGPAAGSGLLFARTWHTDVVLALPAVLEYMASSETQKELDRAELDRREGEARARSGGDELAARVERRLLHQRLLRRRALARSRLAAATAQESASEKDAAAGEEPGAPLRPPPVETVTDWSVPVFAAALRLWESRIPLVLVMQQLASRRITYQVIDYSRKADAGAPAPVAAATGARGEYAVLFSSRTALVPGGAEAPLDVLARLLPGGTPEPGASHSSARAYTLRAEVSHRLFGGLGPCVSDDAGDARVRLCMVAPGGGGGGGDSWHRAVFTYPTIDEGCIERFAEDLDTFAASARVALAVVADADGAAPATEPAAAAAAAAAAAPSGEEKEVPAGFFRVVSLSVSRVVLAYARPGGADGGGEARVVIDSRPAPGRRDGTTLYSMRFEPDEFPHGLHIQTALNETGSVSQMLRHVYSSHASVPAIADFVRRVRREEEELYGVHMPRMMVDVVPESASRVRLLLGGRDASKTDLRMLSHSRVVQDFMVSTHAPGEVNAADLPSYLDMWYQKCGRMHMAKMWQEACVRRPPPPGRWWDIAPASRDAPLALRVVAAPPAPVSQADARHLTEYFSRRVVAAPFSHGVLRSFHAVLGSGAGAVREAASLMGLALGGPASDGGEVTLRVAFELEPPLSFDPALFGAPVVLVSLRFRHTVTGFEVLAPLAFDTRGRCAYVVSRGSGGGGGDAPTLHGLGPDGTASGPDSAVAGDVVGRLMGMPFDRLVATLAHARASPAVPPQSLQA